MLPLLVPALYPKQMLLEPVTMDFPVSVPIMVLFTPVKLYSIELEPTAVFPLPSVFRHKAAVPNAVL